MHNPCRLFTFMLSFRTTANHMCCSTLFAFGIGRLTTTSASKTEPFATKVNVYIFCPLLGCPQVNLGPMSRGQLYPISTTAFSLILVNTVVWINILMKKLSYAQTGFVSTRRVLLVYLPGLSSNCQKLSQSKTLI